MSNINDMNRYAMKRNDVGVNHYAVFGDLDAALHHFHQALAAKLATESQLLASTENNEETSLRPTVDMEIPEIQSIAPISVYANRYNQFDTSIDDATDFVPYLHCRPFTLFDAGVDEASTSNLTHDEAEFASTESTTMCIKIIFNLALMHHMNDQASMKAFSLYEIALSLLLTLPLPSNSEGLLLHIAVLNNYGVWYFQNNEYSSMLTCFEEIECMIDEATWNCDGDAYLEMDSTSKSGILRNLSAFLSDSSHRFIIES